MLTYTLCTCNKVAVNLPEFNLVMVSGVTHQNIPELAYTSKVTKVLACALKKYWK